MDNLKLNFLSWGQLEILTLDRIFLPFFQLLPAMLRVFFGNLIFAIIARMLCGIILIFRRCKLGNWNKQNWFLNKNTIHSSTMYSFEISLTIFKWNMTTNRPPSSPHHRKSPHSVWINNHKLIWNLPVSWSAPTTRWLPILSFTRLFPLFITLAFLRLISWLLPLGWGATAAPAPWRRWSSILSATTRPVFLLVSFLLITWIWLSFDFFINRFFLAIDWRSSSWSASWSSRISVVAIVKPSTVSCELVRVIAKVISITLNTNRPHF